MRLFRDRAVLAIVGVLVTGGWVCQSNVDDPCPGALTCGIDVANVCCPLGSSYWCDGCTDHPNGCAGKVYECVDESRVLDCPFSASIATAQCGNPVSKPDSVEWTVQASGTLTGCGQETAFVRVDSALPSDVSCGDWSPGVFGGCVPTSPTTTTTGWTFQQVVSLPSDQGEAVIVDVKRAHGTPPPTLTTMKVVCSP